MSTNELEDRLKMTDGFEIFYRHWKPQGETKRTVVCMHGIEAHSGAFRFLAGELSAQGADVYGLDRRGFGNSVEDGLKRGDASDFKRHLQDMVEFVEFAWKSNPGKKLYVFGHSLGCAYALWYAANHQESLDGVILAAPPVIFTAKVPRSDTIKFVFQLLYSPKTMYNLLDKWPEAFKKSDEYQILTKDPLCTAEFSVRWLVSVQRTLANKLIQNATLTKKPTIIIQGDSDIITLPEGATHLSVGLGAKDKMLREFPGADHWFYHALIPKPTSKYTASQRQQVSAALNEWLGLHQI